MLDPEWSHATEKKILDKMKETWQKVNLFGPELSIIK